MTAIVQEIFERYGMPVRVEREGQEAYEEKAFVQPVRESDKESPFTMTALGHVDDRCWLCLTRGELREGDRLWAMDRCYIAVNCAAVCLGEQVNHWRTMLLPEKEAAV